MLPRGTARPYSSAVDVVLLRSHPRIAARTALTALRADITYLIHNLRQWNETKTLAETYYGRRLALMRVTATRSKRWAPFGFIGSLSKGLFGTATSQDVQRIKDKVNDLVSALSDRDTVIERNAIALNDSIAYMQEVQRVVTDLQRQTEGMRTQMELIIGSLKAVQRVETQLRVSQLAESILSTLEFYSTQARILDQQYMHQRDWVEAGHLTESLVTRATLQRCLDTLRSPLPLDYIYSHTSVHLLRVDSDRLAYIFQLPNTTTETYTAWHILSLPFLHNGQLITIQPEVADVALHTGTGAMIDTSDCSFAEPLLCHSPIAHRSLPCVSGILTHEDTLLQKCLVVETSTPLPYIHRVALDQVVLTTHGETIEERCPDRPPSTVRVPEGTVLLFPDETCTVAGEGWSFTRPHASNTTVSVTSEYLMPRINLTFVVPTFPPTLPPMNWSQMATLGRYSGHLATLPRLADIRMLTSVDGYVAWAAMAGLLLLCAVAVTIMIERRAHCLRRHCVSLVGKTSPSAASPPKDPQPTTAAPAVTPCPAPPATVTPPPQTPSSSRALYPSAPTFVSK